MQGVARLNHPGETASKPSRLGLRNYLEAHTELPETLETLVAAVGDALGFGSLRSFTAAFMRAVGCTPQQFRRR